MLIEKITLNWEDFFSLINGKSSTHRGGYDIDDGSIDMMSVDVEHDMLKILRVSDKQLTQHISLKKYSGYGIESNDELRDKLRGRKVKKIDMEYIKIVDYRSQAESRKIDATDEWVNEIRIDALNRKIYVFYGGNAFSGFNNPVEILNMDHMEYVECEEF